MNQTIFAVSAIFLFSSCASVVGLKKGVDELGNPVCLTDCNEIPSVIENYIRTHDIITEEDEIDYLLYRIRTSRKKFIRNGTETDGLSAAQFLRWKIGWYERRFNSKIETDEDFILKILRGSEKSGMPYEIIMPNGAKHNVQHVMLNEYVNLERYQGETPELTSLNLLTS